MQISNPSGTYLFGNLYLETSPSSPAGPGDQRIGVGNVVNTNDWGVNGNGGDTSGKPINYSSGVDVAIDTPTTMVLKMNQITGDWSFWINPDLSQPEPAEATLSGINPRIIDGIGYIRFRGGRYGSIPANTNLTDFTNVAVFTGSDSPFNVPPARELALRDFKFDPATGEGQVRIEGKVSTSYVLTEAVDLDFATPDQTITPTGATVGSLNGTRIVTDVDGNATVQFNLGVGKPRSFIRAEEAGPLVSFDFEAGPQGFTASGDWAWGVAASDNGLPGGQVIGGNGSSTGHCWATVLGDGGAAINGGITPSTVSILTSPDIDLSGISGSRLHFAAAVDASSGDTLEVQVRDADDDTLLGTLTPFASFPANAAWQNLDLALPATADNNTIYLEFRFQGARADYLGFYLDDVAVTGP
jgi:hypothetical protein